MSGIPSWAVAGQQVVCIDDDWNERQSESGRVPTRVPMLNEVLTIKLVMCRYNSFYLAFNEIPDTGAIMGWLWAGARFRPIVSQQDDIEAHFKALLDVPEQVGV